MVFNVWQYLSTWLFVAGWLGAINLCQISFQLPKSTNSFHLKGISQFSIWLDFCIQAKFLRMKNHGEKRLSSSSRIYLLPLIMADQKRQSRKEGLRDLIHISEVLWKTVLYLFTRGKQIDNWINWIHYWLILQNDQLLTYVVKIIFSPTCYVSVKCLSLISLRPFYFNDWVFNHEFTSMIAKLIKMYLNKIIFRKKTESIQLHCAFIKIEI